MSRNSCEQRGCGLKVARANATWNFSVVDYYLHEAADVEARLLLHAWAGCVGLYHELVLNNEKIILLEFRATQTKVEIF